jgi:ribosome maturation factor RimP
MEKIEETLKSMIEAEEGLNFYDTQIAKEGDKTIFRVLITRENGNVSIDDCVKITDIVSPFLDVEEPIRGEYNLEVSSAGIERKLDKVRHYRLSTGEEAEVTLLDGTKYIGKISGTEGEKILFHDKSVGDLEIQFSEIKKGKTLFKW